jgi:hypothetical protein
MTYHLRLAGGRRGAREEMVETPVDVTVGLGGDLGETARQVSMTGEGG